MYTSILNMRFGGEVLTDIVANSAMICFINFLMNALGCHSVNIIFIFIILLNYHLCVCDIILLIRIVKVRRLRSSLTYMLYITIAAINKIQYKLIQTLMARQTTTKKKINLRPNVQLIDIYFKTKYVI